MVLSMHHQEIASEWAHYERLGKRIKFCKMLLNKSFNDMNQIWAPLF